MTICPRCKQRTTKDRRPSQNTKDRWCARCGKLLPKGNKSGKITRPTDSSG